MSILLGYQLMAHSGGATLIQSLQLRGNTFFTGGQITKIFVSQPSQIFSRSVVQQDIANLERTYNENGFYAAAVTVDSLLYTPDSAFVSISIMINEGKRSYLDNIQIEGNSLWTDAEIVEAFETRPGNILNKDILEKDVQELVSRYKHAGYPYANVEISEILLQRDGSLALKLAVTEGGLVNIQEVKIEGNTATKDDVILREARLHLPELYNPEKISGIRNRLQRLAIFSGVAEPQLYIRNKTGGLLLKVVEGTTNTFDGVIGYVPSGSTNSQGSVMGFVTIAMNNLFGTARSGRVSWQKDNRNSQEISLSYKEPWIFNIPVNLEGSFFQRQQDTMYLRREVEGKIHLLVDENISLGGLINHEVIIPSVNNGITLVSSSRMITAGIDIRYDTRDDLVSPTSGIQYHSEYRIGNKKIFNAVGFAVSGVSTVQRVSVDLQFFTPVFSRNVLMIGLHGRQITNSQVEVSDLYRFGGTNSLRGYREYEFTGSRIAWTNTEYRFVMARRSLLYGFFDTGYYFLPAENNGLIPAQQKVKYGYGVGMRVETSLGNVGVSFALGEGDSFSEGKIHFGLMNEF